ncbi:MAG: hypothetical protein QOJ64_35 [Acidobacteriota bacterium]|jgi:hypothetical protein|nr:hypothetical protein [Acidobacteriota bacterium]
MRGRIIIAFLLIATIGIAAAGRPSLDRLNSPAVPTDDQEATPEEEREARELALRLAKRLRETEDFGPLISEFFDTEFVERIRGFARDQEPESDFFFFCGQEVILQASADDLRRAYLAYINFWNQAQRLGDASWDNVKTRYRLEGKDALHEQTAWGEHLKLKDESVPREAFSIAKSDQLLDMAFGLFREDSDNDGAESEEDSEATFRAAAIHDVGRLSNITVKLEQINVLLRGAAQKLRSDTESLVRTEVGAAQSRHVEPNRSEESRVYRFDSERLEALTFGLAPGTLFMYARVFPFEIVMAQIDGKLKIVAVYPDIDGD